MSGNTASITEGQFDAFLARLMEPLPAQALHDQSYNRMLRNQRARIWGQQEALVSMYSAALRLHHARLYVEKIHGRETPRPCEDQEHKALLAAYRKAAHTLLLTPANDRAALAWKRRNLPYIYSGSTDSERDFAAEVDRAIAEDDAWLAAHSVRKPNRKKS